MPSSVGHDSYSIPPHRSRRLAGARRYAASDTELSLPSTRLQRPELFTRASSSSPYGIYSPSRHVISTAAPLHLSVQPYSGSPLPQSAPPALHYSVSPYAPIPLPSQSNAHGPISLHPLLRAEISSSYLYNNNSAPSSGDFELDVDLSSSPEAIQTALLIATPDVFQPATQPPLPSMTINHPLLPWYITVHRSVSEHVTVLDVLHAICQDLSKRVERSDRHRGGRDGRRRRIEFLQGRNRFRGLREVNRGEDVWELITL
ncbi:hypothetical protein GYMLUDRAFT_42711 [Collybiopsis luxurians FD-317 M1]|uniref:DUF6699 domain-containing protein n=1 Tax=Collybiopsis luxurians FD-317 M1 TaxID=944289 RepID=A0A0D0C0G4_9AGAR|nr:hypothetical protein GYMLUDRAFT_42711 [Collybiopsis luxurians FD-317 M1]